MSEWHSMRQWRMSHNPQPPTQEVLILTENGIRIVAKFRNGRWYDSTGNILTRSIIAWTELPDVPPEYEERQDLIKRRQQELNRLTTMSLFEPEERS